MIKGPLQSFQKLAKADKSIKRVLKISANGQGRRLYPSDTPKNNRKTGFRVDQGGPVYGRPGTYKVVLQVNKEAGNAGCQKFIKKYGTYHVVATAEVGMEDPVAVIDALVQDALDHNFGVHKDEDKE
jgi:hypothetical protein